MKLDKEKLSKYYVGIVTQGTAPVADLYYIPASDDNRLKHNLCCNKSGKPIWQVRIAECGVRIYYETIPKSFRFVIIREAIGDVYDDAMCDVNYHTHAVTLHPMNVACTLGEATEQKHDGSALRDVPSSGHCNNCRPA